MFGIVCLRHTYIHARGLQTYIHTQVSPVALISTSAHAWPLELGHVVPGLNAWFFIGLACQEKVSWFLRSYTRTLGIGFPTSHAYRLITYIHATYKFAELAIVWRACFELRLACAYELNYVNATGETWVCMYTSINIVSRTVSF